MSFIAEFSESFAYKTLLEHPSPLYRKSGKRYRQNDNRLDPDIDSGYSSPLHKRNQITIGTQSDSKSTVPWIMTPTSIQSDDPSIVSAAVVPQQKFTYAFIAQKEPSPQPVINANQKSANQENSKSNSQRFKSGDKRTDNTQGGRSRSHDSKFKDSSKRNQSIDQSNLHNKKKTDKLKDKIQVDLQSKGNNSLQKPFKEGAKMAKVDKSKRNFELEDDNKYGFSRTKNRRQSQESRSEANNRNVKVEEDNENVDKSNDEENTLSGKKKRRRRRHRKKKNTDDVNDSHDEEFKQGVELHFEDVEEFPDLGSASAPGATSPGVGILYSAVLQSVR